VLDRILDAGKGVIVENIARNANHEQIAQTLVEKHFRRSAGIRAAEDNRERPLALRQFGAALGVLMRMLELPSDKALVASLQTRERVSGGHFWSIVVFRLFGDRAQRKG
jgi:hypothetical protein